MMSQKKVQKWKRAVPIKRPDNIISSDFSETIPFRPSYDEKKVPVDMFRLLSMDYARQWHIEKQEIKEVIVISNEPVFLQRRYVIRGLLRRLQKAQMDQQHFAKKKKPEKSQEDDEKITKQKELSREPSKISVTRSSIEKIRKSIPKTTDTNIEPCGESASSVSQCSSHADLEAVCHRDDLDKRACRIGAKKSYQKDDSKNVGETKSKPETHKRKVDAVPVTTKKEETKLATAPYAATSKTQTSPAPIADTEEECICMCTCACTAFRNSENDSKSSSTLPEYKSISRDSIDDQINPPTNCHIHV
ncbi:hypothetical protein O3M35_005027 [Rhynocoris fuscipes]|uniref:Uncharacterized protein n=1 Tax=Rhynocoris fuscipes TaxID=488301 RepID=A0AAW1DKG8_9HEMI